MGETLKTKMAFGKKDIVVVLGCAVFVLANLGAVGSSGRRRAKEAVCLSNLHKWGVAWKMFLEDNKGLLATERQEWYGPLWPYYKDEKLLICPEAAKPQQPLKRGESQLGGKFNAWAAWWHWDDIFWEDVVPPGKHYIGSYGINMWFSDDTPGGGDEMMLWSHAPGSLLAAQGAERVPMILDAAFDHQAPLAEDSPPEYDGQIYYHGLGGGVNVNEIRGFCINRHHGAVNGVFLDFSARKIGLKELWTLEWHRFWNEGSEGMCDGICPPPVGVGMPTEWDDPEHWMHDMKDYLPSCPPSP